METEFLKFTSDSKALKQTFHKAFKTSLNLQNLKFLSLQHSSIWFIWTKGGINDYTNSIFIIIKIVIITIIVFVVVISKDNIRCIQCIDYKFFIRYWQLTNWVDSNCDIFSSSIQLLCQFMLVLLTTTFTAINFLLPILCRLLNIHRKESQMVIVM